MKRTLSVSLMVIILFTLIISVAHGQSPDRRGTIQGLVYEDVNGDGKCLNTGIKGEGPVEGLDIEFLSSDEKTSIINYTGPEGIYGLYAAGSSYWKVTAKPNANWVVTSENPLWAPLDDENRAVTDVNFCVQKTNVYGTSATVYLPESGSNRMNVTTIIAFLGVTFILSGLALEWRRRQSA